MAAQNTRFTEGFENKAMQPDFYRSMWRPFLRPGWRSGLFLLLLWSIPRFWLALWASQAGSYQYVSLIFVSMWIAPFILLGRQGRKEAGIRRPKSSGWLFVGFIAGLALCALMFGLSYQAYGLTGSNWLYHISGTYSNLPAEMDANTRLSFFLIFAAIGMTFSPIGEELFYRGLIHENFRHSFGQRGASVSDSLAFALVHLAHFGLAYTGGSWKFLFLPALLWVAALFGLCLSFSWFRQRSGSILGAVLAHAGFNLGMNYFIFYHII